MVIVDKVTCEACGWVHFAVSRADARREIIQFNAFFDTLNPTDQEELYGGRRSTMSNYDHCFQCGGSYRNFRRARQGDCPNGCTIQPVLHFDEPDD